MASLCRNLARRGGGSCLFSALTLDSRSRGPQRVKVTNSSTSYRLFVARAFTVSSIQHRGLDWKMANLSKKNGSREDAYNIFDDSPKEQEDQPTMTRPSNTATKPRSSSRPFDCDFLYSPNVILPALKNGFRRPYALYYAKTVVQNRKRRKDDPVSDCIQVAESVGVKVVQVSKHELNDMAGQRPHQGVVLEASKLQETFIKALGPLSADNTYTVMIRGVEKEFRCKPNEPPVWLALDEVVDPQNLGAIMRTAMFMGVDGVIVCHKNSAPLSAVASKASAGALEERPTYGVTSLMKLVQESQANGWDVVGAHISFGSKRNRPLHTWPETGVDKPTLLIVGNEGSGLRKQIAKQCDAFIQIPSVHAEDSVVNSLNVSVATGIVLAKLMNGRFMNLPKNLKMYPHRINANRAKKSKYDDDDEDDDDEDDDDEDDDDEKEDNYSGVSLVSTK